MLVVDAGTQKILESQPWPRACWATGGPSSLTGLGLPGGVVARSAETSICWRGAPPRRADGAGAELPARGEVTVAVSSYRQDQATHFLVRMSRAQAEGDALDEQAPSTSSMLLKLDAAPRLPGASPTSKAVSSQANLAFAELAQLTTETQARGGTLDRWLRPHRRRLAC